MGRVFLEQMSGSKLYNCRECDTNLSSFHELLSTNFTGATGRAYLFKNVINVINGEIENRNFMTGFHFVSDVKCKNCQTRLGWFYEFAQHDSERYKEGKTVLEEALIMEVEGLPREAWHTFEEETEF